MRAQALVRKDKECGDDGLKDTPVPMPNTEVKLQHAESSWGIAPCEDRTLPRNLKKGMHCLIQCISFFSKLISKQSITVRLALAPPDLLY